MTTTITIPTLRTARLILRAFSAEDRDALVALNADPVFRRYLGGPWSPERTWASMETALGQWALRGYGLFVVERDGQAIGRVGILHPWDWPAPELAWGIAPAAWGQGLAVEAATAVRDWAFQVGGLDELISLIDPANLQSVRVAQKLGAVRDRPTTVRDFHADIWMHPGPGVSRPGREV